MKEGIYIVFCFHFRRKRGTQVNPSLRTEGLAPDHRMDQQEVINSDDFIIIKEGVPRARDVSTQAVYTLQQQYKRYDCRLNFDLDMEQDMFPMCRSNIMVELLYFCGDLMPPACVAFCS